MSITRQVSIFGKGKRAFLLLVCKSLFVFLTAWSSDVSLSRRERGARQVMRPWGRLSVYVTRRVARLIYRIWKMLLATEGSIWASCKEPVTTWPPGQYEGPPKIGWSGGWANDRGIFAHRADRMASPLRRARLICMIASAIREAN